MKIDELTITEMKKEKKRRIVKQLLTVVKQYSNFYLVDIETFNAEKTSNLRRECFKQNIKLIVVKNTLLKKVFINLGEEYSALYASLQGNTAIMLSHSASTPACVITEFAKISKRGKELIKPELKAAYVQDSFYIGFEYLETLVNIKSKEELITDVITLLQSPIKNIIGVLSSSGEAILGVLTTLEEN